MRLARGWTQQQLAEAVGVSRQSINSIECNRYVPSLPLALMFARGRELYKQRIGQMNLALGAFGGLVAIGLFAYRFYVDQVWSWDLFAVAATVVVVKLTLMTWYYLTD